MKMASPAWRPQEVLAIIERLASALDTECVPLDRALGRVLRENVAAPEDQPAFDRSAVDGYAVQVDDASTVFTMTGEIRAGQWNPAPLEPGQSVRIATGGALPGNNLRVIMQEDARLEGNRLYLLKDVQRDANRNIRFKGEDARAGQVLVPTGTVLQPGSIGLLASLGRTQPLVTRQPRVVHVATGNEIVDPALTPLPGQIRDSNSALVKTFLNQWGIDPIQLRPGEDPGPIQTALAPWLDPTQPGCDLLLVSGGASVGKHDATRQVLEKTGFTIHVSKTTTRPGKPLIVAQRGGVLAFGLPGNPLAHFVCLNLYVRAVLDRLAMRPSTVGLQTGQLDSPLDAGANSRETFWPAHWRLSRAGANLTAVVSALPWRSSGDLTSLASANALLRIPAGTRDLAAGQPVEFLPCVA